MNELCIRCNRVRAAEIHEDAQRGGTGTAAMHAFVGASELRVILEAEREAFFAQRSRPKGGRPTDEIQHWNKAIDAAKERIKALRLPIDPERLVEHDRYWRTSDDKLTYAFCYNGVPMSPLCRPTVPDSPEPTR